MRDALGDKFMAGIALYAGKMYCPSAIACSPLPSPPCGSYDENSRTSEKTGSDRDRPLHT
jgi:hypothetical protein